MANEEEKKAKDYLKIFSAPKPLKVTLKREVARPEKSKKKPDICLKELPVENNNDSIVGEDFDSHFDDDFEVPEEENAKELSQPEEEKPKELSEPEIEHCFADDFNVDDVEDCSITNAITEENLLNGWDTMRNGVENENWSDITIDASELHLTQDEEGTSVSVDLLICNNSVR